MAVTKEKIIMEVFEQTELSKKNAKNVIELLIDLIKESLSQNDDVLISGFGKFVVKSKKERKGRNPKTKESLQLKARKVVIFKTSGLLREKINNSSKS